MRLSKRSRRRLVVLLAVLLVVFGGLVAFRFVRTFQQDRLVKQSRIDGLAAYEEGRVEDAIQQLGYVLQHDPDNSDVLITLADARMQVPLRDNRHLADALVYYNKARDVLKREPNSEQGSDRYIETLHRMLDLYMTMGLRFELAETADALLEINPDDIEALNAKARVEFTNRSFAEAMGSIDHLIELEPEQLNWRRFKLELMRQQGRNEEELLSLCDQWQSGHDGDGRYLVLRSHMLAQLGRIDEARVVVREAKALGADSMMVLQELVAAMDSVGERDLASQVIQEAMAEFPDEQWVRAAVVRRLWQSGRYGDAIEELLAVKATLDDLDPELQKLEIVLAIASRRPDDARELLLNLIDRVGTAPEAKARLAWAQALLARLDLESDGWISVVHKVQRAIQMQPDDPMLHFVLGETYAQMGETSQALQEYREAVLFDPNWIAAGVAYVKMLLAQGRVEEAYPVARMLMTKSSPPRPSVYLIFAETYLALRRINDDIVISNSTTGERIEVASLLEAVYEVMPESSEVVVLLVMAYLDEGRPDKARQFIDALIADGDTPSGVLIELVGISQSHELGLESQLVAAAGKDGERMAQLAWVEASLLSKAGDAEAGLAVIDRAIAAADPSELEYMHRNRVAYLVDIGDPHAAAELGKLIDSYPQSSSVLSFALTQKPLWSDQTVARRTIDALQALIGERAQQVLLGEASYLLYFHSDDQEQLTKALALVNKVLLQSPDSLAGLVLITQISLAGDQPSRDRAIEHLERAVNLYPHTESLYGQLIQLLQGSGDFERAEQYLHRLSSVARNRPDLGRAELALRQNQGDFEASMLRAVELIDAGSPVEDKLLLAALQQQAGELQAAEETYEQLLASESFNELVLVQASDFYANTGRFERGVAILEQADLPAGPAMNSMLLGMFLQRHGRFEGAVEQLKKAVSQQPDMTAARNQLARYYLQSGDREAAEREALRGLEIDPSHKGLQATLALTKIGAGRTLRAKAIDSLGQMGSNQAPLIAVLQLLQGIPVDDDGEMVPTEAHLAAAHELVIEHPQFMPAWLLAISITMELGQLDGGIELARQAMSRLPAYPEPAEWATRLLVKSERWEAALVEAHEWRRRALSNPLPVDVTIASILLKLNRPGDAVIQLDHYDQRIFDERGVHPDRLGVWLMGLLRSGDIETTAPVMKVLIEEDPSWRNRLFLVAPLLSNQTTAELLEILERDAADPREQMDLAVAWARLGKRTGDTAQLDRAQAYAVQAGGHDEYAVPSYLVQGTIAESRGDLATAEQQYHLVLGQDPQNALALNNLAFVLAQSSTRQQEALDYAERAIAQLPGNPDLLDTYAFVLLALERAEEAEQVLDRALAVQPGDIGIRLRLVELFLTSGREDEAQATLNDVELDLLEQPDAALEYEKRLEAARQRLRRAQVLVH